MPRPDRTNHLYYGDNLDVMRRHMKDESIDLIYLDPPFNSDRDYNVLFHESDGTRAAAQVKAFEDTWRWDSAAEAAFHDLLSTGGATANAMSSLRSLLGQNDLLAYLAMLAPRLLEMRRLLKPTGSIFLHCDPGASHYIKVLMDSMFGARNHVNEIVWRRTHPKGLARRRFARNHDVILAYAIDADRMKWNPPYRGYDDAKVGAQYRMRDEDGRAYQLTSLLNPNSNRPNLTYEFKGVTRVWRWTRERMLDEDAKGHIVVPRGGEGIPRYKRYLDEQKGVPIGDFWDDIEPASGRERLGYPTQKPEALLHRILEAASDEGDRVLDPFCGCGTAVVVAQKLKRRWVGIDITHLAVSLVKSRLHETFGGRCKYEVSGEPTSVPDARALAAHDRFQFQWWALGLVGARPAEKKKGADRGIDGKIFFQDEVGGSVKQIVLSVKSGAVGVADLRDLRGVVEREGAAIGALLTLEEPTKPMRAEAGAGFYESPGWGRRYPRIQIRTIGELLAGGKLDYPPTNLTLRKAPRHEAGVGDASADSGDLFEDDAGEE